MRIITQNAPPKQIYCCRLLFGILILSSELFNSVNSMDPLKKMAKSVKNSVVKSCKSVKRAVNRSRKIQTAEYNPYKFAREMSFTSSDSHIGRRGQQRGNYSESQHLLHSGAGSPSENQSQYSNKHTFIILFN